MYLPIMENRQVTSVVLIPIDLQNTEEISDTVVEILSGFEVVLLGVYEVPYQTAPTQAREHDDGRAEESLSKIGSRFEHAGATVNSVVQFTHHREKTIEEIRRERECDVILLPDNIGRMEEVLVPIRGTVNIDRITDFVSALAKNDLRKITLFHVAESESKRFYGRGALEYVSSELVESGISRDVIHIQTAVDTNVVDSISEYAKDYDAIVMGGTKHSLTERIFGRIPNRIGRNAGCPVFVIPPTEK